VRPSHRRAPHRAGRTLPIPRMPRLGPRRLLTLHAPRRRGDRKLQLGRGVAAGNSFPLSACPAVPAQPGRTKNPGARRLTEDPMGQLFLIAFATFASEDLTCLATGALIASGKLALIPGVLACAAGIYFGDLLL